MIVRAPGIADAEVLAGLVADCMRESYPGHPGTPADALRRDVLGPGARHRVLLAEVGGQAVGFVAWDPVYDMHWAKGGAQVADLYAAPSHRGLGVALALIAAACAEVRAAGGTFLRGGAYDRASTRRFYSRVAVCAPGGDTHLAGGAFRRLADLAGRPVREIVRALPPVAANYED